MTDTIATAEPTETTIKRFLCRHIHTSGHRCGSPALRGEPFCYHHHTTRSPAPRHRGVHPAQSVFEMPSIDDRAGVQFALAQILNRLTTGQLDPKRANPILYTLKLAIWNLHETRPAARTASRSSSHTDSRHSSASSFSIHDLLSGRESSPKESIPDDPIPQDPISSGLSANNSGDLVEELILDEDLGPIAPIAEIPTPEAAAAAARAAAQQRAARAQAAHDASRAAAREAILTAFARFQQENGFPAQPPDPGPTEPDPDPNPSLLSSRSAAGVPGERSLLAGAGAEGSASPQPSNPQTTTNNQQPTTVLPSLQATAEAESPAPRII